MCSLVTPPQVGAGQQHVSHLRSAPVIQQHTYLIEAAGPLGVQQLVRQVSPQLGGGACAGRQG